MPETFVNYNIILIHSTDSIILPYLCKQSGYLLPEK